MDIHYQLDESGQRVGVPVSPGVAARPNDEHLVGDRVRLERLNATSHSDQLWNAFATTDNPSLWTYMPQGPFADVDDLREWISGVETGNDPHFYAIIDLETSRAVGIASYLRIDPGNRVIEVGYLSFSGVLSRTPAATEAMYLMASNAFELGFRRYEWKCNVLNGPSISAAERLGFSFEGVFRNAVVIKGHNRDTAWFAITIEDWDAGIGEAMEQWLSEDNFDNAGEQKSSLRDLTDTFRQSTFPTVTVAFHD